MKIQRMHKTKLWTDYYISSNKFIRRYDDECYHEVFSVNNGIELLKFHKNEKCMIMINETKSGLLQRICLFHSDFGFSDLSSSKEKYWWYKGHRIKPEETYWNK